MTLQETIVATALKYVGETEESGNSGFRNKVFEKEMKAVGFVSGYAWCALFAELVWTTSAQMFGLKTIPQLMSQLFSTGAVATWENFSKRPEFVKSAKPQVSDLVVWQKWKNGTPHWTGHMGIVVWAAEDGKRMITVEGNTTVNPQDREGTAVVKKDRIVDFTQKPNGLNLLGFVHIV